MHKRFKRKHAHFSKSGMININILSKDENFANMLKAEISDFNRDCICKVNDKDIWENTPHIAILDLDSAFDIERIQSKRIVGFSRNENSIEKQICDKCDIIFHRPFLIDELLSVVSDLSDSDDVKFEKEKNELISNPKMELNENEKSVYYEGRKLYLSANEFSALLVLYENLEKTVSREMLSGKLSSDSGNMADVYICHLRKKLEEGTGKKLIYTVRNKGYMLKI